MRTIHSGTTTERAVRAAVFPVLLLGLGGWFLLDGYRGYPRANVVSVLTEELGLAVPDPLPPIDASMTAERATAIGEGVSVVDAIGRLGGEPFRHGDTYYFFGPAGHVKLAAKADTESAIATWVDGPKHTATTLVFQKVLGGILAPIGLIFLVRLVLVLRTRVSLGDDGLRIGSAARIPLDTITGIRADDYLETGRIYVDHSGGGHRESVRLDAYVVKELRAIVEAICAARGFPNPLPAGERESTTTAPSDASQDDA